MVIASSNHKKKTNGNIWSLTYDPTKLFLDIIDDIPVWTTEGGKKFDLYIQARIAKDSAPKENENYLIGDIEIVEI